MIYVSVHEKENDQSLPQKLERAIRLTRMKEYHDDDYDYVVRYPSFFEQTADSLMEKGSSRFCFWQDSTEIVQTTFVEQQKGDGCFILSGHLYTETGQMTGRRFYAKFVQHRKLWFVQTLAYPEECERAVKRLKEEIDQWKVW